jgi:hypothetical protein
MPQVASREAKEETAQRAYGRGHRDKRIGAKGKEEKKYCKLKIAKCKMQNANFPEKTTEFSFFNLIFTTCNSF